MNPRPPRNTMLRLPIVLALCAGVAGSLALSGCGEEPPPPPPPKKAPPPPPPPPPPEISIQALLQEAKADARVAFADSVKITDEALARAVIALADGFARGDANKLKTVLTDGGQNVLNALAASDEWTAATAGIEAVRVVYVGDAGNAFASEPDTSELAAAMASGPLADAMKDAMASVPPDKLVAVTTVLTEAMAGAVAFGGTLDADALGKKLVDAGLDSATADKLKAAIAGASEAMAAALASAAGPQGPVYPRAVVLAVQDDRGAFLLGWGVDDMGGAVKFANAPTAPVTKPRASDFDTIGLGAFALGGKAVAGATPAPGEGGAPGEDPAPGAGSPSPDNPDGPTRKNTPGGPITVPGSG